MTNIIQTQENGFWDYAMRWSKLFAEKPALRWDTNWLENGYCAECRFCCGKQDSATPFPMPLLPEQGRPDLANDFYLLDATTPYLAQAGCKADTVTGCRLKHGQKPMACGLFPIVLINGGLYLYQNCPAVIYTPLIRFMEFAQKAADLLGKLPEDDLRHLSLWFTDDTLAKSYIDLRIKLFNQHGKKLIFE